MTGQVVSHYSILEHLGGGGMGIVYKAQDLRLDRFVALKFLPPELTRDEEAKQRFIQEAKTASALDHPNIGTIYDIDATADGQLFICMAYYAGETLKKRITRGLLNLGEVLDLAIQTAQGLVKAHERGIVHRDIKPANLMFTTDGVVKIVDFGLAKLVGAVRLTKLGTTLGTVAYMSPEQARGEEVDHRTDLWSLGVVVYEMVTGRLPFEGEHPQAVVYGIAHHTPRRMGEVRMDVPLDLESIVTRTLAKRVEERYQTTADLLSELRGVKQASDSLAPTVTMPGGPGKPPAKASLLSRQRLIAGAAGLVALLMVAGYLFWRGERSPAIPTIGRTIQLTRDPGLELDPAISPDGKMIAYAAGPLGQMRLYVRQMAGGRPIPLTEGFPGDHRWPQWSPDGTRIAFQSGGTIYAVPALGGIPKRLVVPSPGKWVQSLAWSLDGTHIAYVQGGDRGLHEICTQPMDGGEPTTIANVPEAFLLSWSPDGTKIAYSAGNSAFIFGSIGNIAPASLWVVPATGGDPIQVMKDIYLNICPIWTPDSRHLLFVSNRSGSRDIYQVPLGASGAPSGPPMRLTTGLNAHTISLSADGKQLAYSVFTYTANIWSIRIPDQGSISIAEARPVTTGNQTIEELNVSPDGRWLAFDSNRSGNQDIYKMPIDGGEPEQLTTDPADEFGAEWSPDGKELAFYSFRTGNRDIFVMSADGGPARQLTNNPASDHHMSWSSDGKHLAFHSDRSGRSELYVLSKEQGELKGEIPRQLTFEGSGLPKWSPDGRLIAFNNRGGLWVTPPGGGKARLLVQGGGPQNLPEPGWPAWSPDSRTVYYRAYDSEGRHSFWAVPAAGGAPRLLVRFDDPSRIPVRPSFTTDGQWLFFALTEYESDVWVMELVGE